MYKGNMQDFISHLNQYCQEHFNVGISLEKDIYNYNLGKFEQIPGVYRLIIWNGNCGYGFTVTDDSDFEEQVYSHLQTIKL